MRFKKSSCPVCSLFFVFSNYLYPALCVTFMLPPHSVAFVFGRNQPVSHLKKILDLSVWNIKPGSCCAAGSFRISSANLAQLPSSSTLLPFPADSGFSPPVCEHFPPPLAFMTSWCCTMRHIRVLMATEERPVQNKKEEPFNLSN